MVFDFLRHGRRGAGEVKASASGRVIAYGASGQVRWSPRDTVSLIRHAEPEGLEDAPRLVEGVQGVALMPGSGEYTLATTPVYRGTGLGAEAAVNINSAEGQPDLPLSLEALTQELPNCGATSLVVSWFGDDLRAGNCRVLPKVESSSGPVATLGSVPAGGAGSAPWQVCGVARAAAEEVARDDAGRPVYGGTPSDASVLQAIAALKDKGQAVMFYPFLLMEILKGNGLPDPWSAAADQPALPWRGRITAEAAPGQPGSPDQTAQARAEVEAFLGTAAPSDFAVSGNTVSYSGPQEWSYRRFILHYAHLCALAGGVSAFCIGSEFRSLTQIRDESGGFPFVDGLRVLAAEVRAILGPDVRIGYAADWSEYFGYHPQDGSGDVLFHLDPLWADDAIDFVGIDNYMPLADWRDGTTHLDAQAGAASIHDLDYLKSNIAGGEGYDWYYRDAEERALQIRTPITDGAHGESWIYRFKDLRNWWARPHHERIGGVRSPVATGWVPEGKPIWFTELGCAAIDKGPNQPNRFMDPKSSESGLPYFSNGRRDDYVQMQFLRAYFSHFGGPAENPVSQVYEGPMVDMSRAFVWAWDARPWPVFPNALERWSDGGNHARGHWLTGRTGLQPLAHVVGAICEAGGLGAYDVSGLHGLVRGYALGGMETARAQLQPLMLAYGFDAVERGGVLVFRNRDRVPELPVGPDDLVAPEDGGAVLGRVRAPEPDVTGQVRLSYIEAEGDFDARVAEARFPDDASNLATHSEIPLALIAEEARGISERWLAEARVARDQVQFALPPSQGTVMAGDTVRLESPEGTALYRVDRVEDRGTREIEAVRMERQIYTPSDSAQEVPQVRPFAVPVPIHAQFMDLPLLTGQEVPHAPHLAVTADPWPGSAAVFAAPQDSDYRLNSLVERPAVMGLTQSVMTRAVAGVWDRGAALRVELARGALSSVTPEAVLNGANAAAIGDGSNGGWEVFQFAAAELVAPGVYDLSLRLRGQAGTDAVMPSAWPAGSRFVLLDGAPQQIALDLSARDLARHYRIGPSQRPYDDPSYRYYVEAFKGIGLRPYAPAHLRVRRVGGDLALSWIRRTRLDGDSWASVDVALGEAVEQYLLRVVRNGAVLREAVLDQPAWTYDAAAQASDGASAPYEIPYEIHVAQVSQSFGPGPFARIEIDE
ncbi:MAG: glycoside hydrolase/phage tail family protein [Paracoccaceae bacterium]